MKSFFVYMLRCSDGSYYVGHTDDLERRMEQHAEGTLGEYTSSRRPVELVWCAELDSRDEALQRELQVKGWTRAKKEALIASDWGRIRQLAQGPHRVPVRPSTSREPGGSRYAQDERRASLEPGKREPSRNERVSPPSVRPERVIESDPSQDERVPAPSVRPERGIESDPSQDERVPPPSVRPERSARDGADHSSCPGAKSKGERISSETRRDSHA